ncbi:O-acetylhomoserine aminocarboxypropyltransferase/cysteine synthase family protein [Microbacterium marinilacus]|uniref:PLP-dependent transferase n=1 Tax=Microbacterium marinilacus TaxID=415209 RepID=A0ABP7BE50_9MICO|nr:aminotransferase class I/II-fold pyridoxal phosphate-dependent enzyme [Microbacterium marinilacus]MBY0690225.1 aminotransferase class I/II-fold pyridoxal phosphate-dependent enzyme [Microbacterium marinilacus]
MTGFSTLQIRAGAQPPVQPNPAVVPIYQTAAYEFESWEAARDIFALRRQGNLYSRTGNPTQSVLEQRIAALDGGVGALAVASGQAAVVIALLALARNGEHVVAARQLYGGTLDLLTDTFADFGIDVTLVDQGDLDAWRGAVRPNTRAFFAETIGNPTATVLDVRGVADVAHAAGVPLIVDNTVATPALLRPVEHGADLVVYSATKYLAGHGGSLGGLIVDLGTFDFGAGDFGAGGTARRWPQFTEPYPRVGDVVLWDRFGREGSAFLVYAKTKLAHDLGPALSPFNAHQILLGIETLDLRIARQTASAEAIARALDAHPGVSAVHHPAAQGSPHAALAARYLPGGASAVFSFDLAAGPEAVPGFVDALEHFTLAANIGDARSLVIHPASTTHSHLRDDDLALEGFSRATVRLSIGLEDPADLIDDLLRALDGVALASREPVAAGRSSTTPAPFEES